MVCNVAAFGAAALKRTRMNLAVPNLAVASLRISQLCAQTHGAGSLDRLRTSKLSDDHAISVYRLLRLDSRRWPLVLAKCRDFI
jgi:hypothetical protein